MPKVPFVLIGVGLALLLITIISLLIASLGRLNTDQSLSLLTDRIALSVIFQLPFHTIPFRRNSAEKFSRLVYI